MTKLKLLSIENKMKRFFLLFFIIFSASLFSIEKIPLIIQTQENIFHKIVDEINKKLPNKIDILVCDLLFLNGDDKVNEKINKNFDIILETQQYIYKYNIEFIKDVKIQDTSNDYSFIDNFDEQELIPFAQSLNKDAILIASVTTLDNQKKSVWDNDKRSYINKNIGIIQGNIFNTETKESMLRFSYYFLID